VNYISVPPNQRNYSHAYTVETRHIVFQRVYVFDNALYKFAFYVLLTYLLNLPGLGTLFV